MAEEFSTSYQFISTLVLLVIGLVVYLPLTIYFTNPLQRAKDSLVFQKRQSTLTMYAIYALYINIITTSIMLPMFSDVPLFHDPPPALAWVVLAVQILQQCSLQFFFSTLFVRLWLFYYDIRYNMISGNDWMTIIDTDYDAEQSWFARVHRTLGNQNFLSKINCIGSIIFAVTDITLCFIDAHYSGIFSLIYLLFIVISFWVFSITLYCLLRKVKYFDDLHILEEFQAFYKVVLGVICFVIIYFLVLFLVLMPSFSQHRKLWNFITLHVIFQTLSIFNISVIYVMSRWIFKKLFNDVAFQEQYGDTLRQASFFMGFELVASNTTRDEQYPDHESDRETDPENNERLHFMQVLQKQEYLFTFMQHLSKEFSMECLLSLIEFIQYRTAHSLKTKATTRTSIIEIAAIKLPDGVPHSSIVYNKEYDNETKARKLYEKYIAIDSDYEINIGSKERRGLKKRYETDDTFGEPFEFDKCIEEMISLLRYSFGRFQNKPAFDKMERFASMSEC